MRQQHAMSISRYTAPNPSLPSYATDKLSPHAAQLQGEVVVSPIAEVLITDDQGQTILLPHLRRFNKKHAVPAESE
jgi:hypothetical protein